MLLSYYTDYKLFKEIEIFVLSIGFKPISSHGIKFLKINVAEYEFREDRFLIYVNFLDGLAFENKRIVLSGFTADADSSLKLFDFDFCFSETALATLNAELVKIKDSLKLFKLKI